LLSDVGEYLLDESEHVGVLDGVDVVAAFSAVADQASQPQLAQVLATETFTRTTEMSTEMLPVTLKCSVASDTNGSLWRS
jgi:hypothetical protein